MNPWQIFWAPQFHFPFGGSVAQQIEPNTNWFFCAIRPEAGDAVVEQQAFGIASYGKQLGLITDLLLDLAEQSDLSTRKGQKALADLRLIRSKIEALKDERLDSLATEVETKVAHISKRSRVKARALNESLARQLDDDLKTD
jgi:hypothetical protein